jgi:CHAP domain
VKTLNDPAVRADLRANIVDIAKSELGYAEKPGNRTKFGEWFGLDGNPWCAMFVSWVYDQACQRSGIANPLAGLHGSKGFASTIYGFARAKAKGLVIKPTEPVLAGDVIVWAHTLTTGHTGAIVRVFSDGSFDVIEGNTSARDHTSRNGGEVAIHRHNRTDRSHGRLLGIIRPTRTVYKP